MNVEVILTPAEVALLSARDLSDSFCVVFDVLRATSTMLAAFANGARRIYPAGTVEEARWLRRERCPAALLGGERGGVRIESFDLGNSPLEYTRDIVEGREIVMTTTNGTVALQACRGSKETIIGAWINTDALAAYLLAHEKEIHHLLLICAGTGANFASEDGLAAGALCSCVEREGDVSHRNDAAITMLSFYRRWSDDPTTVLRNCENGKRLIHLGLEADVEWCARSDSSDWIATLSNGVLEGECVTQRYRAYAEIFQRLRSGN